MKARVLRWNRAAGYGFLESIENPDDDIFVHFSAIQGARRLIEGQEVEFELGEHRGKRVAQNVLIVSNAAASQAVSK
jgi:CspA family cold shock protein